MLIAKHGSVVTGWRNVMDPEDDGNVSQREFFLRCRENGFSGDVRKFWKDLDSDGSGHITLEEIDPEAHTEIEAFKNLLVENYQNVLKGWLQCLDLDGSGRLELGEFLEALPKIGSPPHHRGF